METKSPGPYRTVGLVLAGLGYLLGLGALVKWLGLDADMVQTLANAGTLMVGAGATKSAVERASQHMGGGGKAGDASHATRGVVRPGVDGT